MELKNLNTFIQIAESGSFSKAADMLGYTQSTVSFQIKQLEDELGCRLFDRIGKKIQLTAGGVTLLEHALRVNNTVQDLSEAFHNDSVLTGQVTMFSSDSVCEQMMMRNYHEFYRCYPNINLIFQTGSTVDLLKVLDHNEADIIFTLDSHIFAPEYVILKESPVTMHFVVDASHELTACKELTLDRLLSYSFILTEKNMSYRKILDTRLAECSLQVSPVLETGRTDIIIRSLIGGSSIGFLPDFVTEDEVRRGRLARLNVTDFTPIIWKQLIVHRDKWISRPLRAFIDFVIEHEFIW